MNNKYIVLEIKPFDGYSTEYVEQFVGDKEEAEQYVKDFLYKENLLVVKKIDVFIEKIKIIDQFDD